MGYYKIRTRHEEFQCQYCGFPLVTGDDAYEDENGDGFCCEECAKKNAQAVRGRKLDAAVVSYERAVASKIEWRAHFDALVKLHLSDDEYDEYVGATIDPCGYFCGHDRILEECGAIRGTYPCPLEKIDEEEDK